MRSQVPTALIVAVLFTAALLPVLAAPPRAANELGDDWAVISACLLSVSPLHIGDQNVSLAITLQNLRPGDADAATDELLGKISPFIDIIGGRV